MNASWDAIALGVEIAGGFIGAAWFIVRMIWKLDVRVARIEDRLNLDDEGNHRDQVQRRVSTARVVRMGNVEAPDFGNL